MSTPAPRDAARPVSDRARRARRLPPRRGQPPHRIPPDRTPQDRISPDRISPNHISPEHRRQERDSRDRGTKTRDPKNHDPKNHDPGNRGPRNRDSRNRDRRNRDPRQSGRSLRRWPRASVRWTRLRASAAWWSRSLLFRVVAVTLAVSTLVMVGVGVVAQSAITSRLLEDKRDAALAAANRSAQLVSIRMGASDTDDTSLREALRRTLDELGNQARSATSATDSGNAAGSFEPVIIPTRLRTGDTENRAPIQDVPQDLQNEVGSGYLAWSYTTIVRNGAAQRALVVGSPAVTSSDTYAVYLIFPLTLEQGAVDVVQRTLLVGGAVLALALAAIAALVAWQVVTPVRRAAGVARRLAAGDLAERMPLTGPTEMTTLARSFNGMADAIRAQIKQLEEFGKLQRRFTSDVSHELRTPVTTVRMAADFLHSSRDELPAHLGRSTELLVAELDRFETLLGDLLEISRYDAGMAELSAEPMDLRAIIIDVTRRAAPLAQRAGVRLGTELPPVAEVAEVDTRRIERVLRNLINNAIDHAEQGRVDIELAGNADAVAITVSDYGVGLKPGEAGLVFNRFWRADPSRQRQTGGTGLGLAIALEDTRLHGGWLQATGRPNRGARFRLTLPRRQGVLFDFSPLPLDSEGDDDTVILALPTSGPPAVIDPRTVVAAAGTGERRS